jgi:[ribosomal protein S5]-alanine N-acetyltransferase
MTFEILTTERLLLRKLSPETFDYIYANYSNEQLIDFLGLENEDQLATEKNKFEKGLTTYNKSFLYFQLLDQTTKKIIGWCGFHTWYLNHFRAEIGYGLFDENLKNKGIMTEAMKAVLDYGFHQMQLNRIEAFIGTNTIPSLQLVEKYGFTKEGILRSHYLKNNVMEDSVVYSLLKTEYFK